MLTRHFPRARTFENSTDFRRYRYAYLEEENPPRLYVSRDRIRSVERTRYLLQYDLRHLDDQSVLEITRDDLFFSEHNNVMRVRRTTC